MSREAALAMATGQPAQTNPNPAATVTATPGDAGVTPVGVPGESTGTTAVLDSTRFSQLAKKEAELQKNREALKAEQTQFMTERQKFNEIQKQINSFNETKAKDPVEALKLLGFTEKDLFNFIAAQEDTSTPEERATRAAQSEIQKFKDEQAKAKADLQANQNKAVLAQFNKDISDTIAKNADKYEYCNYNGPLAVDLIEETVSQVLATDGELITVQEAIEMVEQYYEDEDKAMSSLKKRQPRTEAAPAPAADAPLKPQVSPRPTNQARPTLTNKSATVNSTVPAPRGETPDQKKARLVSKYFGPKT